MFHIVSGCPQSNTPPGSPKYDHKNRPAWLLIDGEPNFLLLDTGSLIEEFWQRTDDYGSPGHFSRVDKQSARCTLSSNSHESDFWKKLTWMAYLKTFPVKKQARPLWPI
jgi:hypothetical protein